MTKNTIPNGIYRLEFESRSIEKERTDLIAMVIDGDYKGYQVPEVLYSDRYRSSSSSANRAKRHIYSEIFGINLERDDPENMLFWPFIAEILGERIVSVSKDAMTHMPAGTAFQKAWCRRHGWVSADMVNS
ncbi:hypothetical protein VQ042_01215 [Aurantimonas sp. A2-1-M11]|uniref:hypothetical protein n=1 Tax=Aurantimonas sp. A2-1-M11 TaxID=3113712 RepID=UPI002F931FC0